jgi:hypothetical protein
MEIESVESHFEVLRARDVYPASPGAFDDDVEGTREDAVLVFAFGQDNFFEVIEGMMMIHNFP